MNHDAAHKFIYSLPEVTADLLRLVAPDWVDELNLATLEDRSSEYLDAAHRKRQGDMVWRVCFRKGRADGGDRPFLLVLVEFQSVVEQHMALRLETYTALGSGRHGSRNCAILCLTGSRLGNMIPSAAGATTGLWCWS